MTVEELIEQAKNRFPLTISYKGRLTSKEVIKIEKFCEMHCPSIYMNGTAVYSIRYKKEKHND